MFVTENVNFPETRGNPKDAQGCNHYHGNVDIPNCFSAKSLGGENMLTQVEDVNLLKKHSTGTQLVAFDLYHVQCLQ